MTDPARASARAAALPRALALQGVRLIRGQTEYLGIQKGDVLEQIKLELKTGGRKSPDAANTVQAVVGLECSVIARDHDRVVARVSCEMALDYLVSESGKFGDLTDDDCVEFASTNGVYNAWPYIREFCQSMSVRMLLPAPIILPSLPPAVPKQAAREPG